MRLSTFARFSWVCSDCTQKKSDTEVELYCICRTPYDESQFYIYCDSCQGWFHGRCVGVLQSEANNIDVYTCPDCRVSEICISRFQRAFPVREREQQTNKIKSRKEKQKQKQNSEQECHRTVSASVCLRFRSRPELTRSRSHC